MGGRGSSSGMSGGSGISSFKGAGVRIESDINGLNKALVNKTLNGVRDTLNEFGIPLNTLNGVGVTDSKKAMASVNGFGDLSLSRTEYSSKNSEFKKANHVADSTAYGIGTHEAGHLVSDYAMHKNNKGLSVLEKANMRKSGKWDRQVLKTAKKMNGGSLSAVSKYGSSSKGKAAHEMVTEGVSEYMRKGKNASATSRAIVKALKSYL